MILAVTAAVIAIGITSAYFLLGPSLELLETTKEDSTIKTTPINLKSSGQGAIFTVAQNDLFYVYVYESELTGLNPEGIPNAEFIHFALKPENEEIYREISFKNGNQKTVVIAPIFTITAYAEPGFYSYYKDECDETCINSVPIKFQSYPTYETSEGAIRILKLLGYPFLTDIEIDKNPKLLEQFDKVILLHNEYVTSSEFDAITQHPKVLYLYPNALYAEIKVDYENQTITLVRGHGYPDSDISNGFEWKFDNTKLEYDDCLSNWEFYEIDNGKMLSCYPENIIYKDYDLLKLIKEY